jgi:hypothetical protein
MVVLGSMPSIACLNILGIVKKVFAIVSTLEEPSRQFICRLIFYHKVVQ